MKSGSFAGAEISDLLRPGVEVLLRACAVGEEAGRLEHDVHPEVAPRQTGRVALGEHLHLLAARLDDAVAELDVPRERPEDRVVLEEVCHRLRVAEVVERDDLDVCAELLLRAEEVPADPAEAVDADAGCHAVLASVVSGLGRLESSEGRVGRVGLRRPGTIGPGDPSLHAFRPRTGLDESSAAPGTPWDRDGHRPRARGWPRGASILVARLPPSDATPSSCRAGGPTETGGLREELRGCPLPHVRAPAPGGGWGLNPRPGARAHRRGVWGPGA